MTVKNFGDVEPGDWVLGSDGQPVEVTRVHDVHTPESMWEIELNDGTVVKASGNHLWYCETKLDWELHALRKKESRKALESVITPQILKLLDEASKKEELVETSMADMVTLLQAATHPEILDVVVRVAESLGHVAEQTTTFDVLDDDEIEPEMIRMYDARSFASQLLALTGLRPYRKIPIIVGSVMTTDAMMELGETAELPVTRPLA